MAADGTVGEEDSAAAMEWVAREVRVSAVPVREDSET